MSGTPGKSTNYQKLDCVTAPIRDAPGLDLKSFSNGFKWEDPYKLKGTVEDFGEDSYSISCLELDKKIDKYKITTRLKLTCHLHTSVFVRIKQMRYVLISEL